MSDVGAGALVDGKYRIIRLIGEGGWGVVYEAENVRTVKHVALKLLRPRPELSAEIRTRFEREAQAAGRIGSDHIVEVFDLGTLTDGTHYMVMELLQGQDLAAKLQGGALDPVLAVKIVVQLLEGLAAAHDAGILHRDLKPENLFLVPTRSGEEFVKILDFGISKFNAPDITSATITGAVLGSPVYMAPEQARGLKHVDPRTDLYSVGAVLFETLTGRVPFTGDNFNDLMFKIALAPRPSPLALRPTLDPPLAHVAIKAIASDPKERFQSAGEFRAVLVDWLATQGVVSSGTPELRRAVVTTPRAQAEPAHRTPARAPEAWGAATVVGDNPAGTPLSGASTLGGKPAGRPRRAAFIVIAAALLLFAIVALAGMGLLGRERLRVDTATAPPTAETETPAVESTASAAPSPAALPSLQPLQQEPSAPPIAAPPAPPPVPEAPARAVYSAPRARPTHVAAAIASLAPSTASSQATSAPVAPAPSAPPPPPPKAVDKVEGREFRTGI